eukprot:g3082.t1
MSSIDLSSMLGMKTGDSVKPAITMEPQNMLPKVVLPSQIKYNFKFSALTLPRFAERMAQIREERLLALAKTLATNLFANWKVYSKQKRIVRVMFGKNINQRLTEMIREWKHTAKTIRHFKNMVRRSNKQNIISMFDPWKKYTKYAIKKRRYAYAVYIASNVCEKNLTRAANVMHKWFEYAHKRILLRKSIRRIQLKIVWPSFNSWNVYTTRRIKVKLMLKRHLGNIKIYYFHCWAECIQNIKKNRRRKLKQFAARMKASRLLPSWNAWIYLHSIHKIAKYCQSHYRGNKSRKITDPYIQNLMQTEEQRAKAEQTYLAAKLKNVHWKYYLRPHIRSAYRVNIRERRLKFTERDKAIKLAVKTNLIANAKNNKANKECKQKIIDYVRLSLRNIFTTFIMDSRHGIDTKYNVVSIKHLKILLKECGFILSKVRYEVFKNRIGINNTASKVKETISFDEFYDGLCQMNLVPKSFNFYTKSVYAYRHYTGARYKKASRLLKRRMAISQMKKDLLVKHRLSTGIQPLHVCQYCCKGFLLYTALHKHHKHAPDGCEALILDHLSATNIPDFDVKKTIDSKTRNRKEQNYLKDLIDEIEMEKIKYLETSNFAATEIQKVVRGWNIRKLPILQKMKELYEFSSLSSSSDNSPDSSIRST